jgi:hypothetical protein
MLGLLCSGAYASPLRPCSGHDLYDRSPTRTCPRSGGPTAGGIQPELSRRTERIARELWLFLAVRQSFGPISAAPFATIVCGLETDLPLLAFVVNETKQWLRGSSRRNGEAESEKIVKMASMNLVNCIASCSRYLDSPWVTLGSSSTRRPTLTMDPASVAADDLDRIYGYYPEGRRGLSGDDAPGYYNHRRVQHIPIEKRQSVGSPPNHSTCD